MGCSHLLRSFEVQLRPAPRLPVWLSGLRGFAPKARVVSEANEMFTHQSMGKGEV